MTHDTPSPNIPISSASRPPSTPLVLSSWLYPIPMPAAALVTSSGITPLKCWPLPHGPTTGLQHPCNELFQATSCDAEENSPGCLGPAPASSQGDCRGQLPESPLQGYQRQTRLTFHSKARWPWGPLCFSSPFSHSVHHTNYHTTLPHRVVWTHNVLGTKSDSGTVGRFSNGCHEV